MPGNAHPAYAWECSSVSRFRMLTPLMFLSAHPSCALECSPLLCFDVLLCLMLETAPLSCAFECSTHSCTRVLLWLAHWSAHLASADVRLCCGGFCVCVVCVPQVLEAMHAPVYFETFDVHGTMNKVPEEVITSIRKNRVRPRNESDAILLYHSSKRSWKEKKTYQEES